MINSIQDLGRSFKTGKECALIACCEEEDRTVLDGVRIPVEHTAALNKWKMVGEVPISGVVYTAIAQPYSTPSFLRLLRRKSLVTRYPCI